jgi:rhodanese-related sulfurtransferase
MTQTLSYTLVAAIALGIVALFACDRKAPQVGSVTPQEAMGELRNGFATLLDVREADEVKGGIAQGATWIAKSKIQAGDPTFQQWLEKQPKDKKIITYCGAGGRAGAVATMLAEKGYKTANMGGYDDWVAAGLPTTKP